MSADLSQDRLLIEVPLREGYKVLGPVVLYRRLGKGGMGSVYLGRHLRLECEVAVKCLGADLADDEDFVRRFRAEARSAAQLRHQNIVQVYDVDEASRLHFLVMEYIDGESAGDRVKRKGPLPEGEALAIVLGAAHGLAHAHDKGFVHRDIKPDNILVSRRGDVKVADLGLAKPVGDSGRSMATRTGIDFGTPSYMPPEQAKSAKDAGFAADVYALAATLFTLLTGEKPYGGGSDVLELLQRVVHEPFPDIARLRPDVSPGVAELIERSTRKDPRERPKDARAFAKELAALVEGGESRLEDLESGMLGETMPLVSPPPRDVLTRIEISLRDSRAGITGAGATIAAPPTSPSVPQARERSRRGPWIAAALVVACAAALFVFAPWSAPERGATPDGSTAGPVVATPPQVPAGLAELRRRTIAAERTVERLDLALATFSGLEESLSRAGRIAEVAVWRGRVAPLVDARIARAGDVEQARLHVAFAREVVDSALAPDIAGALAGMDAAEAALGRALDLVARAGPWVDDLAAVETLASRVTAALERFAGWDALGDTPARLLAPARAASTTLDAALAAGDVAAVEAARDAYTARLAALEDVPGRLGVVVTAYERWRDGARAFAAPGRAPEPPSAAESARESAWQRADEGDVGAFVDAQLAAAEAFAERARGLEAFAAAEREWQAVDAGWIKALAAAPEGARAALDEKAVAVGRARAARQAALAGIEGAKDTSAWVAAARAVDAAAGDVRAALGAIDLTPPTLASADPARGTFTPNGLPPIVLEFDEELASATLEDRPMALTADRRSARIELALDGPRPHLNWTAIDLAGNRAAGTLELAVHTARAPEWAELLVADPDPTVVTDADARSRMAETGLAWMVRDRTTQTVMLLVPPGTYERGERDADSYQLRQVHQIRIAKPFYMGQFEFLQEEWARIASPPPSNPSSTKGPRQPVENTPIASILTNLHKVGFRLPRESEWEYVCRAGTTANTVSDLDAKAWYSKNARAPQVAGTKAPNAWGFYDMLGNVWEICSTAHRDNAYADFASKPQPVPSEADDDVSSSQPGGVVRVIRGGSWQNPASSLRPTNRASIGQTAKGPNTGFRVVRDP